MARIRKAVRIHRTQKVYRCTIFRLRKMYATNGLNLSADTGRVLSLRRHRAYVLFTSRRAVLNRGPQFSQAIARIYRNLKDSLSRGQFLQWTQWFPILPLKVKGESILYSFTVLDQSRSISLDFIGYNELFVAKTCRIKNSVCKKAQIIDERISFVIFLTA